MFKKILIANRGEIACRLMRTFQRMGIKSVAVYSAADEGSLHVEMADEAYFLGPPPVLESYLNIQAVLNIASKSRSEAIHPGYGFLSENPIFAQAVRDQGLVFIGPSAHAIEAMGDKLEAKKLAHLAGLSCIPGSEASVLEFQDAQNVAEEIGYPLMVKAAAGGGGKGMRIVKQSSDLSDAIRGAMHEAHSSFGDKRIFLEKYIYPARHIEVQILGDNYGNIIHLGERECSLQRRHQKVIEETPSPSLSPLLREKMGEEAIRLARTVDYSSAGTVEFILDSTGSFYFLEMNTRLQVEHPITEMVTGLDIVEEMVLIAAGHPLRMQQSDICFKGHAIEARIYAEDSSRGFLPSIGRVHSYLPPLEKEKELRLDSGIEEGTIMTSYYDPLCAKLIVHQPTRDLACENLLTALNGFYLRGVETNLHFLTALAHASFFREGEFSVTTLDENYETGFTTATPVHPHIAVGAAAVMYLVRNDLIGDDLSIFIGREAHCVSAYFEKNCYIVKEEESTLFIETDWKPGDVLFKGMFNGHALTLQLNFKGIKDILFWNGYGVTTWVVHRNVGNLIPLMPIKEASDLLPIIRAPMPGLVVDISVRPGERVKPTQPLMVIEAMKMENIIRAQCSGVIENIYVKKGDNIVLDQELVKIEKT